ncbi:uncharacterized protein J7T54_005738 [Emericellopsis cladophorae]|uniref:C3H1-type domain-containing protein n=1 Tax=Emericellopsis cladophorae TaxID=2686198 RepID=A0A9P9XY32_9HYPO|nr:uncharacterized protein J7T54_005738 [Emericellopsis cladophorae]KAI6779708.1 hypothetical protein J7T54_005738 [Emericellopsis cladophorae]
MDTARRQHRRYTTSMLLRISRMPGSNLKRTAALNSLTIPVIRRASLIGLKARLMRQLPCLPILFTPLMLRRLILQPLTILMSLPMAHNNTMLSRIRQITRHLSGVVKDLPFRPPILQGEAVAASMTAGPPRSALVVVSSMHDKNNDHHNAGRKKKRKTNTLGLTPGMESESEDDEGEEAALEKLLGQERYQVDDVAEFLAERKKNFPTKARAEARKNAELASKTEDEESALHKKRDKLRRQLAKVESSIKRKRDLGDEGDEMRDLSLNDSEEDEKPESMTSKPSAASAPPPAKKADVTRHCKYFSTGGSCGKKSKCRFVHDPAVREAAIKERDANNGRLTIQQRLVLNDQEQEDLAILQSIQYLREKGVMKKENLPVPKEFEKRQTPAPPVAAPLSAPQKTSLLPAASASLPPPPPKREPVGRRNSKNHAKPPASAPKPAVVDAQATNAQNSSAWLNTPYSANGTQPDDLP